MSALPTLPSSAPADPTNEVLETTVVVPAAPVPWSDGQFVFAFSGVYTYLLKLPPSEVNGFQMGLTPSVQGNAAAAKAPAGVFKQLYHP